MNGTSWSWENVSALLWKSVLPIVVGLVGMIVLVGFEGRIALAPLIAVVPIAITVFGVLRLVPRPPPDDAAAPASWFTLPGEPRWCSPALGAGVALLVVVIGAAFGGYTHLPVVIVLALAALAPAALRRPGLFLFVIVSLIYLPLLGTYSLWDPWETHYGEVSREILSRDDWISLWWAQEDWFWSKPIFIFWSEAFSMASFGVNPLPDANPVNAEWAIRLPHYLLAMGAVLSTYTAVRRIYSVRAGVLAGLILATLPHFFFIAHQAITDMPFVANVTIAMSLFALAITEDPSKEVKTYRVGKLRFSAQDAVVGLLVAAVLPQVMYLVTRNLSFTEHWTPSFHWDHFKFGSAGNGSAVPGNAAIRDMTPAEDSWPCQPLAQGIYWLVGLVILVTLLRRERKTQALLIQAFYFFCALGFMGKGIPGFALPGLVALLYLIASGRWKILGDGNLYVGRGMLTVAVVGLPWYVAMYMRHGPRFTDRLLIHDHLNRLAAGVHGDKGTIAYFIEQIGYGMFPWIALLPAAVVLVLWARRRNDFTDPQREVLTMMTLWFFAAFTLFSAMVTKFHHYIFPAEPAAAILIALVLDRSLPTMAFSWRTIGSATLAALSGALLALGIGGVRGNLRGLVPENVEQAARGDWVPAHAESVPVVVFYFGVAVLFAGAAWWLHRRTQSSATTEDLSHASTAAEPAFAVAFIAGACILAFIGRDLAWKTSARPEGYERLIHLFVYNYGRAWPDQFDYRPILSGFAAAAVITFALMGWHRIRPLAAAGFLGVSLAFTAWALNVYMIDLSPHWGQRDLIKRYYEERTGPDEPLIAYQMNWKGENFYTGNRANVFVKLDTKLLKKWIADHPGKHVYAILEHSRVGSFRGHMRGGVVKEVSQKRDNNKFVLLDVTLPMTPPASVKMETESVNP